MEVQYHPLFARWLTDLADSDKTTVGNHWYPPNFAESQTRLEQYTCQHTDLTAIVKRGNR